MNHTSFNIYVAIQNQSSIEFVDPTVLTVTASTNIGKRDENGIFKSKRLALDIDICSKYYPSNKFLSNDTEIPIFASNQILHLFKDIGEQI